MAENELQILIKGIFNRIKEKYGYTDEQALIYLKGYEDCAEEHQQSLEKRDKMLRDTVAELCEARRLLKLAVDDFAYIGETGVCVGGDCEKCPLTGEKHNSRYSCNKWKHGAEALKLIGCSENG